MGNSLEEKAGRDRGRILLGKEMCGRVMFGKGEGEGEMKGNNENGEEYKLRCEKEGMIE